VTSYPVAVHIVKNRD